MNQRGEEISLLGGNGLHFLNGGIHSANAAAERTLTIVEAYEALGHLNVKMILRLHAAERIPFHINHKVEEVKL